MKKLKLFKCLTYLEPKKIKKINLNEGVYTAEIYNLQGRIVSVAEIVEINAEKDEYYVVLQTDSIKSGMFILNIKQNGRSVFTQKIFINGNVPESRNRSN
ncbi:MAG: T9SS type A sorting domain-containing protein [Chitinivibrionia bacterium]|nr:T9SS type A sorting domain-containing protein [Chitinivibrionia bacterium]